MATRENDVWRLPQSVKGDDLRSGGSAGPSKRPALSTAAKDRLRRIVSRVPEAMVKVTGRARGGAVGLKAHLDYITRNAKLSAETQNGTRIDNRHALRALTDDWLLANAVEARGRPLPDAAQSVSVILSMPPGSPADRVESAARTWARDTFGTRHDWLMVRHDDTDHPHVHVSIRAVGPDGLRLAPNRTDLQNWRETFAKELRRLGVEAEATPRQARGAVRKATKAPIEQMERKGVEPKVRKAERQAAEREAKAPPADRPEWNRTISARQAKIRDAYLAHAAELKTGDADDRRLARDVERFVAEMPVALTRRQALAVELRQVLERENGAGEAKVDGPAKGKEVLHGARRREAEQRPSRSDGGNPSRPHA
jgi:type IV secretion system T-DNA border endonuclease VirD2